MRLFSATLATETNTFSPLPTSLDAYKECVFLRPGEHPDATPLMCTAPLWVARRRAAEEKFTLVEGSCFAASPAGLTNRADYEFMRDAILAELKAALPVDGVLLGLHGAMVAHGYDDVEGDIIERVREIVGARTVIGVELDPHCHLTLKRVRLSDIIVLHKEFPHTDVVERAEDLLGLVLRALRGEIRPVMSLYDCRQIGSYPTTLPLMRGFVDRIMELEGKGGILSISVGHCFPYADVPELSGRVLVVADRDKEAADRMASRIGAEFVAMRGRTAPEYLSPDAAIDAALAASGEPVVLADPADNAGGGAPSDNTTILRRLIERGVGRAAVGPIWDPIAAKLCFDAGVGARLPLRFGGKIGPSFGHADRRCGGGPGAQARLLAELRPDAGPARGLRGDRPWRGRGGADREADASTRPRAFFEPRHQSARAGDPPRQVHQPLHGRIRPDRAPGAVRGKRRTARSELRAHPLQASGAADLAA